MINEDFFKKRFSVGVALDSDVDEYKLLLEKYSDFIDNVYFSPPFGDQYHGRSKIAEQLSLPGSDERLWMILRLFRKYGVALEAVFNTHLLSDSDIEYTLRQLALLDLIPEKICVQEPYYRIVRECFPHADIVHSVNFLPNDRSKILPAAKQYDEYVVGRQFIRDEKLFREIKETGCRTVLLLNNGCSHICGGCASQDHCRNAFERSLSKKSAQQIYAEQSIMPFELHEGWLCTENVALFKLSTRNGNASYIEKCLDSYIHNNSDVYAGKNPENYLLWSRLAWPMRFFEYFDYSEIYQLKKELYRSSNE